MDKELQTLLAHSNLREWSTLVAVCWESGMAAKNVV